MKRAGIAVFAAVVVLGGAGAGLAMGHSGKERSDSHGSLTDTPGPRTLTIGQTASPGVAGSAAGSVGSCPNVPVSSSSEVGSDVHVFTRSTSDGVTIRVYQVREVAGCAFADNEGGTSSSSAATSTTGYSIEMSTSASVGQGDLDTLPPASVCPTTSTTTTSSPPAPSEPAAMDSGAFGTLEGAPVWWVGVLVGSEVSAVEVKFSDGYVDQMAPIDGVAVLANQVTPTAAGSDPYQVTGTLTLLDSTGTVVATVALPNPTPIPQPVVTPPTPPAQGAGAVGGSAGGSPASSGSGSGMGGATVPMPAGNGTSVSSPPLTTCVVSPMSQ